ncbi:unnamed protein product, partial [Mesorhabditis belari]
MMPQPTAPPFGADLPPSYEVSNTDAPPSYDSLYGEFRQVEDPKGLFSFLGRAWKTITGTVTAMIAIALLNIFPIVMIIIGAVNIDNCELKTIIPKWLIVTGSVHLVKSAMTYYFKLKKIENPPSLAKSFETLLNLFSTIWFILGSIWVYTSFGDFNGKNCDRFMMYFSFVFVTATYAIAALMCCCICCCCCCICFKRAHDTVPPV